MHPALGEPWRKVKHTPDVDFGHSRCWFWSPQMSILVTHTRWGLTQILQTLCHVPKHCCEQRTSALREIKIFLQNSESSHHLQHLLHQSLTPPQRAKLRFPFTGFLCATLGHQNTPSLILGISSSPLNYKMFPDTSEPLGKCSSWFSHHYHRPPSVVLSFLI